MCRQGVVNTRQSGVFAALFYKFFFFFFLTRTSAEVSPLCSAHQVLVVRHVGNALGCFMSADGGGGRAVLPHTLHFRTPGQADYGVLLTRTNRLSVRSEQILLWVSLAG